MSLHIIEVSLRAYMICDEFRKRMSLGLIIYCARVGDGFPLVIHLTPNAALYRLFLSRNNYPRHRYFKVFVQLRHLK